MNQFLKLAFCILIIPCLLCANDLQNFEKNPEQFYLAPSEARFQEFQKQETKLERKLTKQGSVKLIAVMFAKISEKYAWPIEEDNKAATIAKEILKGESALSKYISDDKNVDPEKLDIWWASYFATGDEIYLNKILAYAGEELPTGDFGKFVIIGAATWSFKSNCSEHNAVKSYAIKCIDENRYPHKIAYLKECINKKTSTEN